MYTTGILTALAATISLAAAAPSKLVARDVCAGTQEFPWFITGQNSLTCTDNPPVYPAAESGPPPGAPQHCQPIDPNGVASFLAAAVNVPCTDYSYTVSLFTTPDCSDLEPTSIVTPNNGCLVAPAGTPFLRYSAIQNIAL